MATYREVFLHLRDRSGTRVPGEVGKISHTCRFRLKPPLVSFYFKPEVETLNVNPVNSCFYLENGMCNYVRIKSI